MSRAFVREQDGDDVREDVPERPVSPHPNLVTPEGLAAIEAEIARLEGALAALPADADDASAEARLRRDLRYWNVRHATAEVVPPPADTDKVQFGATVTIERSDGRRQRFRIVGEDEADPVQGTLSWVSPLARALDGRRVGDVVPAGRDEAEIVAIE